MWKPRSSAARATSCVSVKQWNTPPARSPCSALSTASVSAEALRVWITSGQPVAIDARMCTANRSRCQAMSATLRPLSR